MYDRVDISELKNKIFSKVYRNENCIIFENNKEKYELFHDQNCCEDVYIDDVYGELSNLENAEITYAERTTSDENPKNEYDNSYTWTFFKFATNKGWVDVRFYGTSNGYYSEDADLYLVEKKELVNVRVNFMCEQDGIPICMNMGFSLPRSPYVINGIAVDEDTLIRKIHSIQKQYDWSKVWFTLDDMGKIDWSRICNVEVIDNE